MARSGSPTSFDHGPRSLGSDRLLKSGLGRHCVPAAMTLLLVGCITLTSDPRAVIYGPRGSVSVASLNCDAAVQLMQNAGGRETADALDPSSFRLLIWNVHKEADAGWDLDLAKFARTSDALLLQEIVSIAPLRDILLDAGMRWVMASSFFFESNDIGVLTATRIAPLASCTQRAVEPIIRIPKSAVFNWFRIAGSKETLAVGNIHGINFELGVSSYRGQMEALVAALAGHRGPIIVAGDFNTWSDERDQLVTETFARIGLTEVKFCSDQRSLFVGMHLDHVYVRGLELVDGAAIPVTSSDHNPLTATFRVPASDIATGESVRMASCARQAK